MPERSLSPVYEVTLAERLLAWVRSSAPRPLLRLARSARAGAWKLRHSRRSAPIESEAPWCSPNVWERIVKAYSGALDPVVGEYGTGASTLHHIRNLLERRGTYVGVEHEPDWYYKVLQGIARLCLNRGIRLTGSVESVASAGREVFALDTVLSLSGENGSCCMVKVKLRHRGACADPHGATREEMLDYVLALEERCDVAIVDGVARKACIAHVLGSGLLRSAGTLMIHDAGHGVQNWLGRPTLTGTRDYRPEIERLLAMGGELCDGVGFDTWPGMKGRRTIGPEAYRYPLEACFMRMPAQ